jgi:hypothetical protein
MPNARTHLNWSACLAGLLAATPLWAASVSAAADNDSARAVLTRYRLSAQGNAWIAAEEAQLRRQIAGLDALERRHRQAQQQAAAMLEKNEKIRAQLIAAEAAKKAGKQPPTPASSSTSSSNSAAGGKNPEELSSKRPDVTGTGELTPLQTAMIELVSARQAIFLASATIDRNLSSLPERYSELQNRDDVLAALKELGDQQKLGPVKDYRRDAEKARQLSATAQRGPIPVFLECERFRLGVVVNERSPLTMSIAAEGEPTLITTGAALSLDLAPTADAPVREYRRGDRVLRAKEVTIPSIRLGAIVLRDVPALLLPPEGEDLASQLAVKSLTGYRSELHERRMTLVVEPTGDAASR